MLAPAQARVSPSPLQNVAISMAKSSGILSSASTNSTHFRSTKSSAACLWLAKSVNGRITTMAPHSLAISRVWSVLPESSTRTLVKNCCKEAMHAATSLASLRVRITPTISSSAGSSSEQDGEFDKWPACQLQSGLKLRFLQGPMHVKFPQFESSPSIVGAGTHGGDYALVRKACLSTDTGCLLQ